MNPMLNRSIEETVARFQMALFYVMGIAGLGRADILLASFPRSGSTWIRFLLCNFLSLQEMDGRVVGFPLLNQTMVELGSNNLLKPWPYTSVPRVVKTHKRYRPMFAKAGGAIGVIRDPRDVMVSYYHYETSRRGVAHGTFADFIRHPSYGLESWFRHYVSWRDHWDLLIKYENLRNDVCQEFQRILDYLGTDYEYSVIQTAARRSRIEHSRSIDDMDSSKLTKDARFARDGGVGQWKKYFDVRDRAYYQQLHDEFEAGVYS